MISLSHPLTGRSTTVPSERVARVYRLSGWVDTAPKPERFCANCSGDITHKHPNAKYCGDDCKAEYRRIEEENA